MEDIKIKSGKGREEGITGKTGRERGGDEIYVSGKQKEGQTVPTEDGCQ